MSSWEQNMESEGLAKQANFNRIRGEEPGKSSDAGWRCVWATVLEGRVSIGRDGRGTKVGLLLAHLDTDRSCLLWKKTPSNSHIQRLPLLLFQLCWRGVEVMPAWGCVAEVSRTLLGSRRTWGVSLIFMVWGLLPPASNCQEQSRRKGIQIKTIPSFQPIFQTPSWRLPFCRHVCFYSLLSRKEDSKQSWISSDTEWNDVLTLLMQDALHSSFFQSIFAAN